MLIEKNLANCFKEEGKTSERHECLRRIKISEDKIRGYVNKANRNFQALTAFKKIGCFDWPALADFYSIYHLINFGKLSLTKSDLAETFDRNIEENLAHSNKILDLRESVQYPIKTSMEYREFEGMGKRVKNPFNKIKSEVKKE